jgi:hypothetical protein
VFGQVLLSGAGLVSKCFVHPESTASVIIPEPGRWARTAVVAETTHALDGQSSSSSEGRTWQIGKSLHDGLLVGSFRSHVRQYIRRPISADRMFWKAAAAVARDANGPNCDNWHEMRRVFVQVFERCDVIVFIFVNSIVNNDTLIAVGSLNVTTMSW